ncbi:MAG: GIY-YIG nuclease family protein [Elusimicrobiales bacterium]|nr:GIY-YIG nuclease family protein [Elusimicrobiales bacterium]
MSVSLEKIPHLPGVYIIKDRFDKIIYIGKAKDLKNRVSSYFTKQAELAFKTSNIKLFASKIDFIICDSEREALIVERRLISEFKPFFNTIWKDSKTYPYVVITKEAFPRLIITRKKGLNGNYFGPYPKVEVVKNLIEKLFEIRLINLRRCKFNFSLKNPLSINKIEKCLYYHTGQCPAPCDSKRISQKDYMRYVKIASDFFKGKHSELIDDFNIKMIESSEKLDYENAIKYRDFIKAIEHIYERVSVNETNLDQIKSKLDFTETLLSLKNILGLKKIPYHIESFDISNLLNRWAVGSCVCFVNGQKNHTHYRHFRIKYIPQKGGGNDYQMIYEIVKRRIRAAKESNELPDLLLIDGGKGQLAMAEKARKEENADIELISLAKENEEIYTLKSSTPFVLPRDSKELLFLMSVRDETHRFAITYHRKIRSKDFLI